MANLEEFHIPQYEGCGIYAIVNSKKDELLYWLKQKY